MNLFFFFFLFTCALDIKATSIWVRTQDRQIVSLEKWKIDEMNVLESLLSCQRNDNSKVYPINVSTCTSQDLAAVAHAFDVASSGLFASFSDEYVRSLVTIAAQLEAIGMLVLCAQTNMSSYESFFINILEKIKKYCNRIEFHPLGKSPVGNVNAIVCTSDGSTLIVRGKRSCYIPALTNEDIVVVFDVATQTVLRYENDDDKNNISLSGIALRDDGSKVVSARIDDENRSCMIIKDIKNGKNKKIIVDDRIVCGERLRRPINIIIFDPSHENEFFVECFGYLGKLIVHECEIEQENVTDEHIKLLYQLYLSAISGRKIKLCKDDLLYYAYESLTPHMKKMVCEEFGVEIS